MTARTTPPGDGGVVQGLGSHGIANGLDQEDRTAPVRHAREVEDATLAVHIAARQDVAKMPSHGSRLPQGGEARPHVAPIVGRRNDHLTHDDRAALVQASRIRDAGWYDVRVGIAHLVLAFRPTCGLAAPYVVREQVRRLLDENDDDMFDAWGNELVAESMDTQRRRGKSVAP